MKNFKTRFTTLMMAVLFSVGGMYAGHSQTTGEEDNGAYIKESDANFTIFRNARPALFVPCKTEKDAECIVRNKQRDIPIKL